MSVLSLREYQQITKGPAFDPMNCVVTEMQAQRLEAISEYYEKHYQGPLFKHGRKGSLIAQNFVGVVQLGEDAIEILPKIEGSEDKQIRHNLTAMLLATLNIDLLEGEVSRMAAQTQGILDVLIRLFCARLWDALRRGMVRRYEHCEDNLTVLKGRLDFARQARSNFARPQLLACRFDEFTEDTTINRILKAALRLLVKIARGNDTQRQTAELLFCFQDVEDVPPTALPWHKAQTDRLTARYAPLLRLARLFIENRPPDVTAGGAEGFALLFDMNVLFEEYIGRMCQRVFSAQGYLVQLQRPINHLARSETGALAFQLKPDVVASKEGQCVRIIDTKWKRLDIGKNRDGVLQADMYQMYAYAKRYATPDVVLLYPHHGSLGDQPGVRAKYILLNGKHQTAEPITTIRVATVDLRDLKKIPDQLLTLFEHALVQQAA